MIARSLISPVREFDSTKKQYLLLSCAVDSVVYLYFGTLHPLIEWDGSFDAFRGADRCSVYKTHGHLNGSALSSSRHILVAAFAWGFVWRFGEEEAWTDWFADMIEIPIQ